MSELTDKTALLKLLSARRLQCVQAELSEADEQNRQLDVRVQALELEISNLKSKLIAAHEERPAAGAGVREAMNQGPTLSAALESFIAEHKTMDRWTEKTELERRSTLGNFVEFTKDKAIGAVTRDDCMEFFARLKRLPSNAGKKAALKGKSFAELTEPGGCDGVEFPPLAAGTVNDQMNRIAGFLGWATSTNGLSINPAKGISIAKAKADSEAKKRFPFDEADLTAMLSGDYWSARRFDHAHYYWLVLLGMYTGARINELCQLHLADFSVVNGVDVISIADEDNPTARAKTASARRTVPIHDELIRLGLLRWVERLRGLGGVQLFPELKEGRDGFGTEPSKWFRRFTTRCGVWVKQEKVFHSFRVGFISQLMNRRIDQPVVAAIVGHETGTVTGDVYWNDRDVGMLQQIVNLVTYPGAVLPLVPALEDVTFTKQVNHERPKAASKAGPGARQKRATGASRAVKKATQPDA